MNEQNKKVPTVRFKGFTNDWEQRKLGDVVNLIGGGPFKSTDSVSKGIPWLKIANVGVNGITWNTESYLPEYFWNDYPQYQLKKGNYVVALTRPILNHRLKISKLDRNVLLNQRVAKLTTSENLQYIVHLLERKKVVLQIENNLSGSDPPNLSSKDLYRIKIKIPSESNEQKQIGTFLTKLDSIISLQQRKLALLKQLKKGMLQKMFADKGSKRPILRFEGFNDDWEGRKLENSADYIRGSFPQPYGNKEWYGGTNAKPFVQVVDVNTNMRLNKKTKEQISVLAQPKSRFVPSDSIVVTLQGSIGRVAITQYDSYVDRTLLIFTKYKVPVDKYFWAYSIQNIFRIEKQKAPGGTIKTITKRALSSFEVSLPVQEEQKKIGTLLKNIDDIITSQQEEVSKLKKIKKSLLQQMFI